MAIFGTIVLFLSRFNAAVRLELADRPFDGFQIYVWGLIVVLGLVRISKKRAQRRVFEVISILGGAYIVLALISGLVNEGVTGLFAAIQVISESVAPFVLAWILVDRNSRGAASQKENYSIYLMYLGIIIPSILIFSAIRPDVFSSVMGWSINAGDVGQGFMRGWSPIGSTITTGFLVLLAHGLSFHKYISHKNRIDGFIALLTACALIFTVSRSVVLSLIAFYLSYVLISKKRMRVFSITIVMVVAVIALAGFMVTQGYNFDRLMGTDDFSTYVRYSSAQASLDQVLSKPVLGGGPGLVYSEIRINNQDKIKYKTINGKLTVMEPHNGFLLIASEHGLLGLSVCCMLFWWMWLSYKREARVDSDLFRSLLFASCCFFLTNSDLVINSQFSVIYWFIMLAGLRSERQTERKK
ncbi:MAG: O-antigen ligase family protein [bacterium]|nr:O-antigen ligase family protein [bacterium]